MVQVVQRQVLGLVVEVEHVVCSFAAQLVAGCVFLLLVGVRRLSNSQGAVVEVVKFQE